MLGMYVRRGMVRLQHITALTYLAGKMNRGDGDKQSLPQPRPLLLSLSCTYIHLMTTPLLFPHALPWMLTYLHYIHAYHADVWKIHIHIGWKLVIKRNREYERLRITAEEIR